MTKKRHAKLMRAFVTRVHEEGKKQGYTAPHGKALYKCVYMAEQGLIPKIPDRITNTRLDWWQNIGAAMDLWGMDNIKEIRNAE